MPHRRPSTACAIAIGAALVASCGSREPTRAGERTPPTAPVLRPATTVEVQDIAMNWHRRCFHGSRYRRESFPDRTVYQSAEIALRTGRYTVRDNVLCVQLGDVVGRCRAYFIGPAGPAIRPVDDLRKDFLDVGSDGLIPCSPLPLPEVEG